MGITLYLKALAFTFVQALLYFDARYPLNGSIYFFLFPNGFIYSFVVNLSIAISCDSCSLMYFLIVLSKTFYSHTCISSLNAYQISSMNFFLSSIPLYLKHYITFINLLLNLYFIYRLVSHSIPLYKK